MVLFAHNESAPYGRKVVCWGRGAGSVVIKIPDARSAPCHCHGAPCRYDVKPWLPAFPAAPSPSRLSYLVRRAGRFGLSRTCNYSVLRTVSLLLPISVMGSSHSVSCSYFTWNQATRQFLARTACSTRKRSKRAKSSGKWLARVAWRLLNRSANLSNGLRYPGGLKLKILTPNRLLCCFLSLVYG